MIHFYFGIGFSVLALIVAGLAVRKHVQHVPFGAPEQPNPYRIGFLVLALVVALLAPTTPSLALKGVIGLTLLLLLIGEALMAIPGTPLSVRLGTNSAIYFVLWLILARMAFGILGQQEGWLPRLFTLAVGIVPVAVAGGYFFAIRAPLGDVRLSTLIYVINAALTVVMAAMVCFAAPSAGSGVLLAGVIFLVAPDALLGWSKTRGEIALLSLLQMLCLFAAGLLLAWSTWGMLWGGAVYG